MSAVKTIGIIGGGQLGLMIIEQAHLLGARTICLCLLYTSDAADEL